MELSKHFDDKIKRILGNLEQEPDPDSWNLFQERMDTAAQQEMDDLLKNRLNGLESIVLPGSWDALEQMIEADEAAEMIEKEAPIDNLAYEKLHNLEVPYDNQHWTLMAKRLEEEFSLRHKLYRYKVAELALMALFLLTIIRFAPLAENWFDKKEAIEKQSEQIIPQIPPSNQTDEVEQWQVPAAPIEKAATKPIAENTLKTESKKIIGENPLVQNKKILKTIEPIAYVEPVRLFETHTAYSLDKLPQYSLADLKPMTQEPSLFEQTVARNFERNRLLTPGINKDISAPEFLASLGQPPVQSKFSWELPAVKTPFFKKARDLRFSIFTTTDINYVTTPPEKLSVLDTVVTTNHNATLASGYGGGVNVSFKRNKWEFQTGGLYSFKRYIPNTPIFITKTINYYIKEDFNGVQLDIFQLPLNALYHFKNTGKWRFYASAGTSAHFITASVYEIEYERRAIFAMPQPAAPGEDQPSIREDKDFPTGLVDGGTLKNNFYMTANLGLGVERYVSPKWTIFFQPNYQHFLMTTGIGANKDKIYTTSIYLGTKFNLK